MFIDKVPNWGSRPTILLREAHREGKKPSRPPWPISPIGRRSGSRRWNVSLFDRQNLAETTSDAYPGERLVACYNPLLAADRKRTREELLAATEQELIWIAAEVARRTKMPLSSAEIGIKVGRCLGRYKMAKHFHITIEDGHMTFARNTPRKSKPGAPRRDSLSTASTSSSGNLAHAVKTPANQGQEKPQFISKNIPNPHRSKYRVIRITNCRHPRVTTEIKLLNAC